MKRKLLIPLVVVAFGTGILIVNNNSKKQNSNKDIINNETSNVLSSNSTNLTEHIYDFENTEDSKDNLINDNNLSETNQNNFVTLSENESYYRKTFTPTDFDKQEVTKPYMIGEFMRIDDEYYGPDMSYYSEDGTEFGYVDDYFVTLDYLYIYDEVLATSSLNDTFSANNIISPNRLSTWSEGVAGSGINESITINKKIVLQDDCTITYNSQDGVNIGGVDVKIHDTYDENKQHDVFYNTLCIVNGYATNEQTFKENNRVKDLALYINDEYYGILRLEDTINPQYFELKDITTKTMENTKFTFEIRYVYKGTKYDDTCLTGIKFGFTDSFNSSK